MASESAEVVPLREVQDPSSEYTPLGYQVLESLASKVINGLSREPSYLAGKLFEKGFLSQEKMDEIVQIQATDTQKAQKIYSIVLECVQHFPLRYSAFISVFKQNHILYDDLLQDIKKKECCLHHSNDSNCDTLPQKRRKHEEDVGDSVLASHQQLSKKVEQLQKKFKALRKKAWRLLQEAKVSLDSFYGEVVSGMDVSLRDVASKYIKKCFEKIKKEYGDSLVSFWGELNNFWDFFNFELFELVVEVMFAERDVIFLSEVQNYSREVKNFSSSTKVCDFLNVWPFSMKKPQEKYIIEMKKVTLEVNKKWKDCTLHDLKNYSRILAQTFFLPREFFLFSDASSGSVSVVWHVPLLVARELEAKINENISAILLESDFVSITVGDTQVFPLTSMRKCSLHLRSMYETKFVCLDPSKSSFKDSSDLSKMPFNLALIKKVEVWSGTDSYTMTTFRGDSDDVRYRKSPTTLQTLGKTSDGSSARLTLLEGAPGVGKTTFSRDACLKWARSELLNDTSLLALFPLRDYNLRKATDLQELLAFVWPGAHKPLVKELEASKGRGMTFWLDGWDEIASSLDGHSSVYEQLVSGAILPEAKVIATSRSWATNFLKAQLEIQPSQHIEIVSSIQDQINRLTLLKKQPLPPHYISLVDLVLKNVRSSPPIRDNMHTPLATEITLAVYKWCQESSSPLPTTVTQLYNCYTCLCIHKYLDTHPHFIPKLWKSNEFKKLPQPLRSWFFSICLLAYDGLLDGQRLEFPSVPNNLKLETLGLMQAQPPLYGDEESSVTSYHFNHLTLQEFLCALYLSFMTEEDRSKNVAEHIENGHFIMVMRFLSGLTKSFPVSEDQMRKMIRSGNDSQELTVFHWLFEGGNKESISDIVGEREARIKSHFLWSPLDYFVTGHCITRSNCQWDIDFGGSCMGDEKLAQFFQAISEEDYGNAYVTVMDLSHNEVSHSLCHLKEIPPPFLHHLTSLDLSWNSLDSSAVGHLADAVSHMPKLKVLDLRWNARIQSGGVSSLALELCNNESLKELNLTSTKIGMEDCKELAKLLSSTQSLETLNVSDNTIPAAGIRMLFRGLQLNSTLKTLDIHGNRVSVRGMRVLSSYLKDNASCKLKSLDLRYCEITPEVAAEFSRGLSQNCSLKLLRLSYNPIGDQGAVALGQAMRENKILTKISLVDCSIATIGGAALAASLMVNSTMDKLYINTNSIGVAIQDFAPVLRHSKKLKILDIRNDSSFGQADVNVLLDSLRDNQVIEELRLPSKYKVESDKRVQWQ